VKLFHILHDPTFEAQYAQFQAEPAETSLAWLGLLFAILSIAVTALDETDNLLHDLCRVGPNSIKMFTLRSRFRKAAMQCLEADQYLWRHNIFTLQTLILLIYGINHSHGKTWALLGSAYNIALSLGCHVDPEHFPVTIVQQEERRRCWAGLIMLYTVQNTSMGCLDLRVITNNVCMPRNVNDTDLLGTGPSSSTGATQMSYILHKFRLYEICSKICTSIFNSTSPSYEAISSLDQEISQAQEHWKLDYATHSQHTPLLAHHKVHLDILYGYSDQLILLLHRPIIIDALRQSNGMMRSHKVSHSRMRCIQSARGLLFIHNKFFESPDHALFRWYNEGLGSFHAFHAAIVLFALLNSSDTSSQYFDMKHTLKQSLLVFEAMASRGRICAKAATVLRYLL
jgi:hypothetical protein